MSPTVISIIVMVLAEILPKLRVTLGSDALTSWVSTTVLLVAGLVAAIRHVMLKKQALGAGRADAFGGIKH